MKKPLLFIVVFVFGVVNVSASPPQNVFDDSILAYHTYLMDMTPLDIQAVNDGVTLPNTLVISPGRYMVYGQTYDMTQEGLYRFFRYSDLTAIQRIVYTDDPIALISSVQWLVTQAYTDNSLTMTQLANKAKTDKLRVSCGIAVDFIKWLMPQYGYQARYAGAMTQENWNYVNDGHAMVEIYLNGKWVLFDPAFNARFWRSGEPLNLPEIAEDFETVEIEYMAFDTSYDVSGLWYQGHSLAALMEPMLSPELLREFYKRHLDSLIVMDGGKYYYYDAGTHEAEFRGWGWYKLTQEQWVELLYP